MAETKAMKPIYSNTVSQGRMSGIRKVPSLAPRGYQTGITYRNPHTLQLLKYQSLHFSQPQRLLPTRALGLESSQGQCTHTGRQIREHAAPLQGVGQHVH